jgi:putative transposase
MWGFPVVPAMVAFPVQDNEHLLSVHRYMERNPQRARLCKASEQWPRGGAWRLASREADQQQLLAKWPIKRPRQWRWHVN